MLAEVEGEMLRAGRRDDRVSLETLRDYDGRDGLNG
jgi:hypothetical protein